VDEAITISLEEYETLTLDTMRRVNSTLSKLENILVPNNKTFGPYGFGPPWPGTPPLGSVIAGINKLCDYVDRLQPIFPTTHNQ